MLSAFRGGLLACAVLAFATPALAQSQSDIASKINSALPDNGRGQITAQGLRGLINSLNNARGVPNGIADLGSDGTLPIERIPSAAIGITPGALDQALGGIANKLPGTPSSNNLIRGLQDVLDFYAYGGKADGFGFSSGHPLSSVTSINGTNTTGYTLAQWKTFYSGCVDGTGKSPVTALTNDLDEIAIQCVINKKTGDSVLTLPSGVLYVTKPIASGQYSLDVRGQSGAFSTKIVQRVSSQDAWHHGTAETSYPNVYPSKLSISNVNFLCGPTGTPTAPIVCGTALKASFRADTAGFSLTDVGVSGFGDQRYNYWHDGIACNNCSLTNMSRVSVGGANTQSLDAGTPNLLSLGTGIAFTGNKAVQFTLRDVTTNYWRTAVSTTSGFGGNGTPGSGTNLEGFIFDNWQANQVYDALVVSNTVGDGYHSPQYVITNSQFNVAHRLFYIAQAGEVFINNNLIYAAVAGAQTGGTPNYTQYTGTVTGSGSPGASTVTLTSAAPSGLTAGVPFFGPNVPSNTTVASVSGSTVTLSKALTSASSGAQYIYGAGTPGFNAEEFMIFNDVIRLSLRDNIMSLGPQANISTFGRLLYVQDALLTNNRVQSVFNFSMSNGWFNDTGNVRVWEEKSAFLGASSWFNPAAGALNGAANGNRFESFYKSQGTALRSDGSLQYDGTQILTLDANKLATAAFPPVFTAAPNSILAQSGDFGVAPVLCGPNYGSLATTGVTISCPAAAAGATVRINFSVSGPR